VPPTTEKEKVGANDLEAALAKLSAKFRKGCVSVATQAGALTTYNRIETGVFAVDYLTGGGIPHGKATLLFGMESGGKSVLAMKTIAGAQRMCREHVVKMVPTGKTLNRCPGCGYRGTEERCPHKVCQTKEKDGGRSMTDKAPELQCPECKKHRPHKTLYMDSEGSFTVNWAARMGVDCSLVHIMQPESAEEAMDASMLLLETGQFDFVIVDTLAQLVPQTELEESAERWQQGLQARLINKALRSWVSAMNAAGVLQRKRVTFLLVNQIRFKIGVMFGDPTTRPGGKGQDFAVVLELKMWAGKFAQDELKNTLGVVVCMDVEKNKTAPTDHMKSNFRLWLRDHVTEGGATIAAGDTDELKVLMDYALRFEIIKHEGGKYEWGGKKVTSREAIMETLATDADCRENLRRELLGMALGEVWWSLSELDKARKRDAKQD
jgi:RecA/RadA recombinase